MAAYECSLCGMSVNATCGKCNEPLVDDTIDADGSEVQVSRCPMVTEKLNHLPAVVKI